jgi:hypothetical protein
MAIPPIIKGNGCNLVVVQLGDIIGRSYEDREALDFMLEVWQKAEEGGGRVYTLIGNHEVFGRISRVPTGPRCCFDARRILRKKIGRVSFCLAARTDDLRLRRSDATRMIVAHSVHDSITARCEDKVWAVDVAMSRYYGGEVQVLEVIDDEILQIIEF